MSEYIKEYTQLSPQEKRQLHFKRAFKKDFPDWDDSMILLRDQFDKFISQNARILDAGCGNGNFVIDELLNSKNFSKRTGFDVSPEVTAKNNSMEEILYGNLENLPFEKDSFDGAISLWVLEHLENPEKVFEEISRVLTHGGIFAFVNPYANSYLVLMRRFFSQGLVNKIVNKLYGREDEDIFKTYYRANTLKDIENLAKKSGFKVLFLKTNFDPSYTSFNSWTYLINKILYQLKLPLFNSHVVGVLEKL